MKPVRKGHPVSQRVQSVCWWLSAGERPELAFRLVNPTSGDIGRFLRHTPCIEGRAAGYLLSRPISPGGEGGMVPPPSLFRVGGGGFGARR